MNALTMVVLLAVSVKFPVVAVVGGVYAVALAINYLLARNDAAIVAAIEENSEIVDGSF